jgi:hypothetical protein
MHSLYQTDFYAWTQEQAKLLRKCQWSELDLSNLIEEIESLGKQERQELRNISPSSAVVAGCLQFECSDGTLRG